MISRSKIFVVLFALFSLCVEATLAAEGGSSSSSSGGSASSGGGGGGASAESPKEAAADAAAEERNKDFTRWMLYALAIFAALPFIYRFVFVIYGQMRLLVSMHAENQRYFATPSTEWIPWVKKHVLYSPLFRTRHNREFQLSSAVNVGTLPTRFQTFFLLGYLVANVVFTTYMIDFTADGYLDELRNRTGVLATVNMVPLFLFATRNSPLVQLLGMSFDTFNLVHRWLGRIVVSEALVHTFAWVASSVSEGGWAKVQKSLVGTPFITYGLVGTVAMTFLMFQSPSAVRHAFYETFLTFHILGAVAAIVGVYYHLKLKGAALEHWLHYIEAAIVVWAVERGLRLCWIVYRNLGRNMTTATVEALPGEAVRVTLRMARPWRMKPGQHLYLYMPSVGLWTSHPFTIAWSETEQYVKFDDEKLSLHRQDIMHRGEETMSLIIRARTGFTASLYNKAMAAPENVFSSKALVEGPYGKLDTLSSYGTVVLIAGGVGITHPIPFIRKLVDGYAAGTVATRRITLVWVIQTPEHLEWIRPWMTEILAMEKRRDILKILLFVTKPKSPKEIHSPSATVQMFPGRPNIDTLLNMEVEARMGSIGVTVCGSGSLSDDVRRAVRNNIGRANIDFIEEAFSW